VWVVDSWRAVWRQPRILTLEDWRMPRAEICALADELEEVAVVNAWLMRWRSRSMYVSDNEGCGCCVNLYRVDASQEALDELPTAVFAESEWSRVADAAGG